MLFKATSLLFRFLLLLTIPTAAFPIQQEQLPPMSIETTLRLEVDPLLLNYDDVLDWVGAIEEDEIDDKYSPEQVEKIAYFLSFLAWNGGSSNNPISCRTLQQDIQTLLCDCFCQVPYDDLDGYSIYLAISYER